MGEEEMILSLQELFFEEEENNTNTRESTAMLQVPLNKEHKQECEEISKEILAERIEEITGYKFRDEILLQQAFTHQSFEDGCCSSLERSAYYGDSILNHIVTMEQCSMYPDLDPGKLTQHRAINVDTEKLARAALKNNLHKLLRHNITQLIKQIEEFEKELEKHQLHSCGLIDAPKVLADMVESLIGAVFSDSGSCMNTTSEVTKKLLDPMITPESVPTHPVTQLNEICQKKKFKCEIRDLWKDMGDVEYIVDGRVIGSARYIPKRAIAKSRAALAAFQFIKTHLTDMETDGLVVDDKEETTSTSL